MNPSVRRLGRALARLWAEGTGPERFAYAAGVALVLSGAVVALGVAPPGVTPDRPVLAGLALLGATATTTAVRLPHTLLTAVTLLLPVAAVVHVVVPGALAVTAPLALAPHAGPPAHRLAARAGFLALATTPWIGLAALPVLVLPAMAASFGVTNWTALAALRVTQGATAGAALALGAVAVHGPWGPGAALLALAALITGYAVLRFPARPARTA